MFKGKPKLKEIIGMSSQEAKKYLELLNISNIKIEIKNNIVIDFHVDKSK